MLAEATALAGAAALAGAVPAAPSATGPAPLGTICSLGLTATPTRFDGLGGSADFCALGTSPVRRAALSSSSGSMS